MAVIFEHQSLLIPFEIKCIYIYIITGEREWNRFLYTGYTVLWRLYAVLSHRGAHWTLFARLRGTSGLRRVCEIKQVGSFSRDGILTGLILLVSDLFVGPRLQEINVNAAGFECCLCKFPPAHGVLPRLGMETLTNITGDRG